MISTYQASGTSTLPALTFGWTSVVVAASLLACSGGGVVISPSYDLAHNTDRTLILDETSQVLSLYNFIIESNDTKRDRGALQTFWRTNDGFVQGKDESERIIVRDRAFLNMSPRGRSSIVYNVYQMVNATLQFEIQLKQGDAWVEIAPFKEYEDQYGAIVRDIRNRMLRYQREF